LDFDCLLLTVAWHNASTTGGKVMTMLQDLQRTISHFVDGRRRRKQLQRELAHLEAIGSLDAVLTDAGLARSQIEPLIVGCAASSELLDKMLARLGIDAAQLPVESLRDISWTCTTCPNKRRCRKWLSGIAATDFRTFCPNAAQLDEALLKQCPGRAYVNDCAFQPSADDLRRVRTEASRREARRLLEAALMH
jgi:hypothetical protein